jgi:hypothetical protein
MYMTERAIGMKPQMISSQPHHMCKPLEGNPPTVPSYTVVVHSQGYAIAHREKFEHNPVCMCTSCRVCTAHTCPDLWRLHRMQGSHLAMDDCAVDSKQHVNNNNM